MPSVLIVQDVDVTLMFMSTLILDFDVIQLYYIDLYVRGRCRCSCHLAVNIDVDVDVDVDVVVVRTQLPYGS